MLPAPRTLLVTAVLVLALVAGATSRRAAARSAIAVSAGGTAAAGRPAPLKQTLFGLNVPSWAALDSTESAVGARSAIVGTFADWKHYPRFPVRMAEAINARGAVPMIAWEPWDWNGGADQPAYALRRILAGDHDKLIDRWAADIAGYRRPV